MSSTSQLSNKQVMIKSKSAESSICHSHHKSPKSKWLTSLVRKYPNLWNFRCFFLALICSLSFLGSALADVGGTAQSLYQQFQVFGGAQITGNTLMGASASNPLVNSRLLSSSPGDINGIPFDATIEGAYLFWSASTLNNTPDQFIDLTLPDGTLGNDITAERCLTLNSFGGFFACRADVTQLIQANPGVQNYNGRYTVSDLQAEPGTLNPDGSCVERRECQAKYAAWSLVLVYTSPSSSTLRDVTIYDGFRSFDETPTSPGIATYSISGFDFPENGRATLSYLGMEGDALLGVPPQDTDPNQQLRCATCFDFFEVNGTKLNDANNPPNNVFNSSSEIGYTLGVDLDSFDISQLLSPGDSVINLRVGSGDGQVSPNPMTPDPGGGGELFLLSYIVLSVDRNAPNFNRDGTQFTVIPDEAAPLERVVFTLRVQNQGSLTATGVNTRVTLPTGLTYFPGSLRIDGLDPIPGQEQDNPLAMGYNLGQIPFQGDTDRIITFRASIDQGVSAGTQLISQATISATNLSDNTELSAIVTVLGVPPLGQSTMTVVDGDGDGLFSPGELIQYRIRIPNPNTRPISGVRLINQLPPYLDLFQVISGGGDDLSDPSLNRVQLENLNIDANAFIDIVIVARLHESDQLEADGIPPASIDGFAVANQAQVSLGADQGLTDDPRTSAGPDETIFLIDAGIDISGNGTRKEVSDINGGLVEPGDTLRYSIRVRNTGASGGTVTVTDRLPIHLENCQILSAPANIQCREVNGQWLLEGNFDVLADDTVRITFTSQIKADTDDQTAIVNEARLVVQSDNQTVNVRSPQLIVTSAPNLLLDKRAESGSTINRLGTVRYTLRVSNTGNREATNIEVIDPIRFAVTDVLASNGGVWTADNSGQGGRARWIIPTLSAGEELNLSLELDLADSVNGGATLSNQAQLRYEGLSSAILSDDPETAAVLDPTIISVLGEGPLLSLSKSVSPTQALPGEQVSYRLVVRNVGDAVLSNVTVLDQLPNTLENPLTNQGIAIGNNLRFDQNSLAQLALINPTESVELTFRATVTTDAQNEILNQASASADGDLSILSDDPSLPGSQDATRLIIEQAPQLKLTKIVEDLNGGAFEPGDMLRYTLIVEHLGGVATDGLSLQDPIPLGLSNVSPLDGGRLSGGVIQWSPNELSPAQPRISLRFEAMISPQAQAGQVISNQAQVSANNLPENLLSDNPQTPELNDPTSITVQGLARLSLASKTVSSAIANVGDELIWTITIANEGPSVARNLVITDPISEWLSDVEAIGGSLSGGQAVWNVGDLGVNQSRSFTLRSRLSERATPEDIVANQARIRGDNLAEVLSDDPSTALEGDPTQIQVLARPSLSFTKAVAKPRAVVSPNERFRYVINVQNIGETALNNVVINDQLVSQLSPVNAVNGEISGQTATWIIPTLLPNAERNFTLEVQVSPNAVIGELVNNQASLSSSEEVELLSDDPSTADLLDPTQVRIVGQSDLVLNKQVLALGQPAFAPGTQVRYVLTIQQVGTADANNVVLTDPIPLALSQITSPNAVLNNGRLTWNIPTLSVGEEQVFEFTATISAEQVAGSVVANQAEVQWAEGGSPILSDNPDTPEVDATIFTIAPNAEFILNKRVRREDGLNTFTAGAVIIYDFELINNSQVDSAPLLVTDALSPSLELLPERDWVSPSGLRPNYQGQEARWEVPPIPAGQSVFLRVGVRISDSLSVGQVVLNQAELSLNGSPEILTLSDDPNTSLPNDPTSLTISDGTQIRISKQILQNESDFAPGGLVRYQMIVENLSNQNVDRILLLDPIPANTTFAGAIPPAALSADGTVNWPRFTLAANESRVFELEINIGQTTAEGTLVSNQARLNIDGSAPVLSDDPTTSALFDPTIFNVSSSARLRLEKTIRDINGPPLKPNDLVEFSLTITNISGRNAQDIEVIDPLSALLTDAEATGGTINNQIARWRILQLNAGASRTFNLSARVSQNTQTGDLLTNQFAARLPNEDFILSPEVSERISVDEFSFTKQARPILSDSFVPNGGIEYDINITNNGQTTLENLVISDPIAVDFLSEITTTPEAIFNGQELIWDSNNVSELSSILPGQTVRLSIRAQISSEARVGQEIANQALLRLNNGEPSSPLVLSDDPQTSTLADPTVITVSTGDALRFTKDIVSPASRQGLNAGDEVTYLIQITNLGTQASPILNLGDVFDENLRVLTVEVNGVSRDPLSLLRGSLALEPLAPNESREVRVTCQISSQVNTGTQILNQATLSFEGAPDDLSVSDDPRTPQADDPTAFTIGGEVELAIIKTARLQDGAQAAQSGDLITWSIRVQNQGLVPALQFSILDEIPTELDYVPNTMTLSGQRVSDALDRDPAVFIVEQNQLNLQIAQLDPGKSIEFSFQTQVKALAINGPQSTSNQALININDQSLLSDNDASPENGINPTVVQLERPLVKSYLATLVLNDPNGPPAQIADEVSATLNIQNTGSATLNDLEVNLPLVKGLIYKDVALQPNLGELRYEPSLVNSPEAETLMGTVYLRELSLESGTQIELQVNLQIDPQLTESKALCLQGQVVDLEHDANVDQGEGQILSNQECFDGQVVFGRLSGNVFQDLNQDGNFTAEEDLSISGMIVSVWHVDQAEGEPVATDFSEADGSYLLENLRPGRYQLRLKSSQGVAFSKSQEVVITALEENIIPLEVRPSGRVYDSVSGDLLDGAQVFLYRDVDTNDDPFDLSSKATRELVPDSDFTSATQQGQRVAHGGMYYFDLKTAGRYYIKVVPSGVRYVSPSTLVPPRSDFVTTTDDILRLSPLVLPRTDANEERTHTLAFEINEVQADRFILSNNHIALDPLSSLIQIDKRSRKTQYMQGDIVTYEIDVINRSPQDLVYNSNTKAGGVYIEDILPKGLKYIAQSAVWVEVTGAKERPLFSAEPSGYRILRFGRTENLLDTPQSTNQSTTQSDANMANPQRLQRPLDLVAGGHLRLRYQVVVGPQAKPLKTYINKARVLADGDIAISATAQAKIQVIADPDFDQGLLLGRVWCDDNKNQQQDDGEKGLMSAKIYFDSGMYAVTDSSGKYHFKMIDPGSHAVKIDKNSLLPGAELTTDEIRVIYFSRGLPAKVDFGVTCPRQSVADSQITLGEDALKTALEKLGREAIFISGNTEELSLNLDNLVFSAPPIDIQLQYAGEVPDLPLNGNRNIDGDINFDIKLPQGLRKATKQWTLWVAREGSTERPVLSGMHEPPLQLSWNGTTELGERLALQGRILNYRLEIITDDLVISSPLHRLGIGVTVPPEPEVLLTFPSMAFNAEAPQELGDKDIERLKEVVARLKQGYEGRLVVDVHGSGEEDAAYFTSARAESIANYLKKQLNLKDDDIDFEGSANQFPLVANLTFKDRQRNRRVLIRLEQTNPDLELVERLNEPIKLASIVRAGNEARRPQTDGRFVMVTDLPSSGLLEVYIRATSGASVTFSLPLQASKVLESTKNQKSQTQALESTQPIALGGEWGKSLSLAGKTLNTDFIRPQLTLASNSTVEDIKLSLLMQKTDSDLASYEIESWSLLVIEGQDSFEVEKGQGPAPEMITWSPLDPVNSKQVLGFKLLLKGQLNSEEDLLQKGGLGGKFTAMSQVLWLTNQAGEIQQKAISTQSKQKTTWSFKLDQTQITGTSGELANHLFTVKSDKMHLLTLLRPDGSSFEAQFTAPRYQNSNQLKVVSNNVESLDQVSQASNDQRANNMPEIQNKELKIKKESSTQMNLWLAGGSSLIDQNRKSTTLSRRSSIQIDLKLPSEALLGAKSKSNTQTTQDKPKKNEIKTETSVKQEPVVEHRHFGSQELYKASQQLLKSRVSTLVAQELEVQLPQGKSIQTKEISVIGQTNSANRIYLNNVEVKVDETGRFTGAALLSDSGHLEIKSVDPQGNTAIINKQYELSKEAWFLLAMGESLTGALGSELDGVQAHTSTKIGDQIYVHGRAVAYLKGRVKGDEILGGFFKNYEVTAHLDTAKQQAFESYFRQMIDPDRYYPVYGDSAQEIMDVNSRGPLYVLVKADKSLLQVGNFRTQLKGIELLNYDRSLYGSQVSLDLNQGDWRHQAQLFGASQDQAEKHAYVELRGTGGSLYYLPHRELVEGSERLYVIERDKISNMERRRVTLSRNLDYTIRYPDGRILLMKPISSTTMDSVGALPQPSGSQVALDGHPTFIAVEYDHRDARQNGEDAWGAYIRETWQQQKPNSANQHQAFSIGGGFIQEQQGDVADGHYRLWGGHLSYQHARKTGFAIEYAKSVNQNAENLFSQDGGLSFQPFNTRNQDQNPSGDSFLVKAQVELDDLVGKGEQDWIWLEGYWRYAAPGFYAGGNIQQQGTENYGFKTNYRLNKQHLFTLSYDEMATKQTPFEINPFLTDYRRQVTRATHQYTTEKYILESAWTRTINEQALDSNSQQVPLYTSDVLSSAVQYKLSSKLTLLGEQEVVLRGDRRLYEKSSDLFVSSLGARYKLSSALQLEAVQSMRWSGDNATQLGLRSELDDKRSVYAQQRLIDQLGRRSNTTVIGAEERFAQGARAFSEYQFESGQLGQRNRAILGVGKRTQVIKGLTLDANYQRSQVINNFSSQVTGAGDLSQDALSLGIEWFAHPQIKLSSRVELRFDDSDEWLGLRDKKQILALNNLSYQAHPDLTLQFRFNYSITEDLIFKATEAEFMEASFGAAYRPLSQRWLAILFKASSRFEQRPVDLAIERPEIEEMGVLSLIPIIELPYNFQLVEKFAYKRSALIIENLLPTVSHSLLWINRLNYHLTRTWDIGAEYRVLQNTLAQSTQHGALFELNYIIKNSLRIGAGYNFTHFTDDEFARYDEQYGGPFFRVMAQY